MKISVDENNELLLEEVYNGIGLKTRDGETFGICMRDICFEFNYGGEWWEAKHGVIRKMKQAQLQEKEVPDDAHSFEVFHLTDTTAFVGFKLANGNFHFIEVPRTTRKFNK